MLRKKVFFRAPLWFCTTSEKMLEKKKTDRTKLPKALQRRTWDKELRIKKQKAKPKSWSYKRKCWLNNFRGRLLSFGLTEPTHFSLLLRKATVRKTHPSSVTTTTTMTTTTTTTATTLTQRTPAQVELVISVIVGRERQQRKCVKIMKKERKLRKEKPTRRSKDFKDSCQFFFRPRGRRRISIKTEETFSVVDAKAWSEEGLSATAMMMTTTTTTTTATTTTLGWRNDRDEVAVVD